MSKLSERRLKHPEVPLKRLRVATLRPPPTTDLRRVGRRERDVDKGIRHDGTRRTRPNETASRNERREETTGGTLRSQASGLNLGKECLSTAIVGVRHPTARQCCRAKRPAIRIAEATTSRR